MTWPDTPLAIKIEIALDGPDRTTDPDTWAWEDITDYGREAPRIVITHGDQDEWDETPPSTCRLTLDNRDGRFSRRNAAGPYYGRFGRSTPIRVSVDPDGDGWRVRFFGEVQGWPKTWDRSGLDSTVEIECAGTTRRLKQGNAPIRSALTQHLATTSPVAWWPLEDGRDSTIAVSGIDDGIPLQVARGVVDFVADAPPGAAGSAHPDVSAANALVAAIAGASATAWHASIWTKGIMVTPEPEVAYYVVWEITTTRGYVIRAVCQHGVALNIGFAVWENASAANGDELFVTAANYQPSGITGDWLQLTAVFEQTGSDVDTTLYVNEVEVAAETWPGITLGAPAYVRMISPFGGNIGTSAEMAEIYISHFSLFNGSTIVQQHQAGLGWPAEPAADRITRLCGEHGIPVTVVGSADTEPMGPQQPATLMALLRQCEEVDGGVLMDNPAAPGVRYVPRAERYNLFVNTLNVDDGDLGAEPIATDDDLAVANEVTVTRTDGASYTTRNAADIAASGVTIADSVTLPVAYDAQVPHQAGWRLNLLSVDEDRWPRVPINLARRPELVDWWLDVTPGQTRIRIDNPPAQAGVDPVDVLVEGYTETISQVEWRAELYCAPASPWTVGVVEDDELGRADTDGSKIVGDFVAGTDTSALVAVTDGPPWITSADHSSMFPFEVRSGGVVLEVTGVDAAVVDSFDRTVAAGGWGTADTGQTWTVGAGTASDYSVVGGTTGRIATSSVNTLYIAHLDAGSPDAAPRVRCTVPVVPTGAAITVRVAARMTDTSNYYEAQITIDPLGAVALQIFKRVAGAGSAVSSAVTLPATHSAGNSWWLQLSAIGNTLRARAWKSTEAEPAGWHITATDTSLTTGNRVGVLVRRESGNTNGTVNVDFDDFDVPNLQVFSLTQAPVNGVERTIPAGTPVSIAQPWRLAL